MTATSMIYVSCRLLRSSKHVSTMWFAFLSFRDHEKIQLSFLLVTSPFRGSENPTKKRDVLLHSNSERQRLKKKHV